MGAYSTYATERQGPKVEGEVPSRDPASTDTRVPTSVLPVVDWQALAPLPHRHGPPHVPSAIDLVTTPSALLPSGKWRAIGDCDDGAAPAAVRAG